jgi:uncharacterized protein YjiS (DUF1127 family)
MPTVFIRSSHPHGLSDHTAARGLPATFVTRLGAAVAQAYWLRRDTRQLMAYGDAMLHDIGVGRGEVERAVRAGRDRG